MDVLLTVLGIFGLIPILCMTLFYTVIPLILVGLQVLGAIHSLGRRSEREPVAPLRPEALDRAA